MWTRKEYHHVDKGVASLFGKDWGIRGEEVREEKRMAQ